MTEREVIRAWKDRRYRERMPAAGRPSHPAGTVELSDEGLVEVAAGFDSGHYLCMTWPGYCGSTLQCTWGTLACCPP